MTKFYEGKPCRNCGTTKKYKSTRSCVHCLSQINKAYSSQTRREFHLKTKYGLSQEEYAIMVERQGNGCAICGSTVKLNVDHDHATGKIRGLLCHGCNVSLGHFRDDTMVLKRAIEYLERH